MAGTGEYYAKLNKSGDEKQIPYDLTHKWSLINKTNLLEIFRNDKCSNEVKNSEWDWHPGKVQLENWRTDNRDRENT